MKNENERICVRVVAIDDESIESYETIYLKDASGEEWKIRRLKRNNIIRFYCKKHPQLIEIAPNRNSYFRGTVELTNCNFREYYFVRNIILKNKTEFIWEFFFDGLYSDRQKGYKIYVYK